MGWWKVQGTDDLVGDEVFSLLRRAAKQVVEEYRREMGRIPTRAEWERLIADSLEPTDEWGSMFQEGGRPHKVGIERGDR